MVKNCPEDKILNPETNRCVKKDGKIGKLLVKSRRKSKQYVPCKEHQYRDPITNRCRNKEGGKSRRKSSVDKKSRRKSSVDKKSRRKSKQYVPCKEHQYRDPITNRCRNKEGGKSRRKSSVDKKSRRKSSVRQETPRQLSPRWNYVKKPKANCIKRSNLPLRDLQVKVVQYMDTHDGILVMHGTGAGKTLTAITVSQCYLDKNPKNKVVFVGPASLASNFKKELKNYGLKTDKQYDFYSFDKFYNKEKEGKPVNLKNKLLIVDEAHNLRNPTSLKSMAVVNASYKADKRLLLSATPFVNNLQDFIPLINMIYGKKIVGTTKEYNNGETKEYLTKDITEKNLETFKYLMKDKLDFYMTKNQEEYPERIEHIIKVPMTQEYYDKYKKLVEGQEGLDILFSNPNRFYNGYRRAVNKAGPKYYSMKIKDALPIIKKGKCIIYTNWIEFGVKPIIQALKENKISYQVFSGETNIKDRQTIVNSFNNDEFKVLLLTKAGGEGLDLKGTKSVIIMDPTWNDAGLEQIIGRAIRYKSHHHLPKSQRKVNVYFMILKQPVDTVSGEVKLGDVLLYDIIKLKNEINTSITSILQEMSI
jgi:SNF2 family DNA or RNA helicase